LTDYRGNPLAPDDCTLGQHPGVKHRTILKIMPPPPLRKDFKKAMEEPWAGEVPQSLRPAVAARHPRGISRTIGHGDLP
jgi:hypothetical protein